MTASSSAAIGDRLTAYLQSRLDQPVAITELRRFPVGFSWITYGFTLETGGDRRELILRIAPESGILPPYRAAPEFAILSAVEALALPIPHALWYSDDPADLGAAFIICTKSPGDAPLMSRKLIESGGGDLPELAKQFVDHLAKLHGFAWEGTEFARLVDPATCENAALAELGRWNARLDSVLMRPEPVMEWARRWLIANAPVAPRVVMVHGDYRLGNFLAQGDRITGLLDWELAHLGDPQEDLGWALMPDFNGLTDRLFGVMDRSEVYDRYQAAGGAVIDPAAIDYYGIMARYKLVCICFSGLHAFARLGTNDVRTAMLASQRAGIIAQLSELADRL